MVLDPIALPGDLGWATFVATNDSPSGLRTIICEAKDISLDPLDDVNFSFELVYSGLVVESGAFIVKGPKVVTTGEAYDGESVPGQAKIKLPPIPDSLTGAQYKCTKSYGYQDCNQESFYLLPFPPGNDDLQLEDLIDTTP